MPTKVFDAFTRLDASDVNAYLANKSISNAVINGAFEINQRGFTSTTTDAAFGFDRWFIGLSGGSATYSKQDFTPGTAPLSGGVSFARIATTVGNDFLRIRQRIEDVRTFSGSSVTLSFYAKGTNPTTPGNLVATTNQNFGSGGSSAIQLEQTFVLTADWTRFSLTFDLDSMSGKTIGANSYLEIGIGQGSSTSTDSWTLDIWGVQVEPGTVANDFRRNANSLQGELAACQRYYYRTPAGSGLGPLGVGYVSSSTVALTQVVMPVTMRALPISIEFANIAIYSDAIFAITGLFLIHSTRNITWVNAVVASGLTPFRPIFLNENGSGFIGINAEL
jgi:hypothetical protein